jgi:hypothetical protein
MMGTELYLAKPSGSPVKVIDIDPEMRADSDDRIPTQAAVVRYVEMHGGGLPDAPETITFQPTVHSVTTVTDSVPRLICHNTGITVVPATESSDQSTGSMVLAGGLGIAKSLHSGHHTIHVDHLPGVVLQSSSSFASMALDDFGGLQLQAPDNVTVTSKATIAGDTTVIGHFEASNGSTLNGDVVINGAVDATQRVLSENEDPFNSIGDASVSIAGGLSVAERIGCPRFSIMSPSGVSSSWENDDDGVIMTSHPLHIDDTTAAESVSTGAIVTQGGIGCAGDLYAVNLYAQNTTTLDARAFYVDDAGNMCLSFPMWRQIPALVSMKTIAGIDQAEFAAMGTSVYAGWKFTNAHPTFLYGSVVVPPDVTSLTTLPLNIHWALTTTSTDTVYWRVDLSYMSETGPIAATESHSAIINAPGVAYKQKKTMLGGLQYRAYAPGTIIMYRIARMVSVCPNDAWLLGASFGYQADKVIGLYSQP